MQPIVPTGEHNPTSHTKEEILRALRGVDGVVRMTFHYHLLDSDNTFIRSIDNVVRDCSVEQNWLADIKRSAQVTIEDRGGIDYLSHRFQPWVRVWIPPYGKKDYVEWPQGVFLFSTPPRTVNEFGVAVRDGIQCYDSLLVLAEDMVTDRYFAEKGELYTDEIASLLSGVPTNITTSNLELPNTREWEPGTPKLVIVNDLLSAINYESLSFDEWGNAVVTPYVSPQDRPSEYTYEGGQEGVVLPDVEQELDLFGIPNRWVATVSEPDIEESFTASYTNNDPGSPTSTVRRQRVITDFRTEEEAADLPTLQAKVERLAFEASQVYEAVSFDTGMMPFHSGNDVYRVINDPLAINAKYAEHTWSMQLTNGAVMSHRARRVVQI